MRMIVGYSQGFKWWMFEMRCHHKMFGATSEKSISDRFLVDTADVGEFRISGIKFVVADLDISRTNETGREMYKISGYKNLRPLTDNDNFWALRNLKGEFREESKN